MASFVESATLLVKDESSGVISKVNAELKKLAATAKSIKSTKIDFAINAAGITKATSELNKLSAAANKLKSAKVNLGVTDSGAAKAESDLAKLTAEVNQLKSARVNIGVNASGVAAAGGQITSLRSQARKPISLKTILEGTVVGQGVYQGLHALGHEAREGVRSTEVGEAGLALKQFTPEHLAQINDMITDISKSPGGAMFQRGAIAQQMNEMLGTLNIGAATGETGTSGWQARAANAKLMAQNNLELAGTLVKLGESADEATEDSIKFGKAIDQSGTAYDKATGLVDPDKLKHAYDSVRQLIPAVGREMTGSNYLQVMKYLRASKYSLSDESMAIVMHSFEELGTGAAVGLNQMIKSLGNSTTAANKAQASLGLLDKKGQVSAQDASLIREHPEEWVNTRLVPGMIKTLMARGMTREQAEAKTYDPATVTALLNKAFPNRTATDIAALLTLQRQDYQQFLKDWASRTGDADTIRAATQDSVLGAGAAVSQQLQSVFGSATRAAAPLLVPALGFISEKLRNFADTTHDAFTPGPRQAEAKVQFAKDLAGGAASLFLAKEASPWIEKGMNAMLAGLKPLIEPIGLLGGLEGLASSDPAVRTLSAAGIDLIEAAGKLDSAANKIAPGPIDKAIDKAETAGEIGIGAMALKYGKSALSYLRAGAGEAAGYIATGAGEAAGYLGAGARAVGGAAAEGAAYLTEGGMTTVLGTVVGAPIALLATTVKTGTDRLESELLPALNQNNAIQTAIQEQLKQAQQRGDQSAFSTLMDTLHDLQKQNFGLTAQINQLAGIPAGGFPVTPVPATSQLPTAATPAVTEPVPFTSGFDQIAGQIVATTNDAAGQFQSAFSTGAGDIATSAGAIATAGGAAGAALEGYASSTGNIIGSAAAAQIRAAVSGISVNVNVNQPGGAKPTSADPGTSSP